MKKKGYITFIVGIILAVMFVLGLPVTAVAEDTPDVIIPVTIELDGVLPESLEEYKVLLTADDGSFPMPEGSVEGNYTLTLVGAETKNMPAISYSKLGVYTYTISQLPGENPNAAYDRAVYNMTVYITNAQDGSGMEATVAVHLLDSLDKLDRIVFTNVYTIPPVDLAVRKVWQDNGKDRPSYVDVSLYDGETLVETIRLDASNDWTYAWTGLAGDGNWGVKETAVPSGYKASYKTEDGVITITNTSSLIQTGQLNWPIYLMSILGVLFIACGIYMSIKKKKSDHAEE